ncbi:sugar transferase [Levilactobacillus andaensis]|uniref:sugar transferase n=1 Tax=Levilactobacillus andaensis TaxID=2799570 RepID=UPI0019432CF4|nr:sugar transferase [Levilactobacillus andaensis]
MNNYVLEVNAGQSNSAGSKAKADITFFLKKSGFHTVKVSVSKNKILRLLFGFINVLISLKGIKKGTFVFQYPMYSKITSRYIMAVLRHTDVKKVILIHDVESFRLEKTNKNAIQKEVSFFNQFDKLISHNKQMTNWLRNNGVNIKIVELEIFDYDNPTKRKRADFKREIQFAGNLDKSVFLTKLETKIPVNIMGPNPKKNYPENVKYLGMYTPEEVPRKLNAGFGLVWDGDSVSTCSGLYGEYMKINNPHKVSLYLSSGLPVIIWDQAALADFVRDNNVGLTLQSLEDLDRVIESVSSHDYNVMLDNVQVIEEKLRNGNYTNKAIKN